MSLTTCLKAYTNHGSWVCETCMAKTFISIHDLWPEGASMPQTGLCIVGLRSKNRPATHQPQPFQKPNLWTLYTCVKVMNVVNSLHDPNFTTLWSMSWPDSNQQQPLCLPWVPKRAPGNFCVTLLGDSTACLKHLKRLKPGHLGTCCLQSQAPGLLALRHRCRAAAAGLTPCWFATPKPKPGQHGW